MARSSIIRLRHVVDALQTIAPTHYAQSWDNVGLLAGDLNARCKSALLCIDMMPAVVNEAIAAKVDLVVSYHPPLFKPVDRLVASTQNMEGGVYRCIRKGIAVYSPHTALDVAPGGTNDVLAGMCDVVDAQPLSRPTAPSADTKLVVFLPATDAERVVTAMSRAGAGVIGDYRDCSFRSAGTGTFTGGENSQPGVGKAGQLEHVAELRVEMVCPTHRLVTVIDALRQSHPYEEPAFDVYPRTEVPKHGIGRVGALKQPVTLKALAQRLKRRTKARCVSIVGNADTLVSRAIVGVGAAGSMPFSLSLASTDVVVTGEMRHHDALRLQRSGANAVVLSHWSSERPALATLAQQMEARVAGLSTQLSTSDCEPFERV